MDNAYLLDFDLSILGSDWDSYRNYTIQIRKEYKIYPDFMYKSGRKKVLQHFLERETLYFTEAYQVTHENRARENLKKELQEIKESLPELPEEKEHISSGGSSV